jgi:conjugative relaxase-like TrwC/TraI family protein
MVTISRPLSARQLQTYHADEFANAERNYYTAAGAVRGSWHGRLADAWGLHAEVRNEQFDRLANGQHPITGEQLVRVQTARERVNAQGRTVRTLEHRAGWDATFSAPKSVSLTALVGGDPRVRDAFRAAATMALDELERSVQARLGGVHPPETTGRWVAAIFEHDSARPVDGYAAPQLHMHAVFFNVTETASGDTHALQPRELFKAQRYATAVFQSDLAVRLRAIHYDIERGRSGQPEIAGYSAEYLEASSPRRRQITAHLAAHGVRGARAAQIAAHRTRDAKLDVSLDELHRRHRELAARFGDQPAHVVQAARDRRHVNEPFDRQVMTAKSAVTFARDRTLERDAVVDERLLLADALKRSLGDRTLGEIRAEVDRRAHTGEFVQVAQKPGAPARAFTTPETIDEERDIIRIMRAGQRTFPYLVDAETRQTIARAHPHLSAHQRIAVDHILASRDRLVALEGVAGAGKTTSLAAIRAAAERDGYLVEGFAPTSRAAQKLAEAGIVTSTLQQQLARGDREPNGGRHLYVLDESSLASTRQMRAFLQRLGDRDRVLLVGDVRQHQAVDAGRPYQQLQDAGLDTARLDEIVRQRDPSLKAVVEQLARGEVRDAIQALDRQGRVHEIPTREARLQAIAADYVRQPAGTLVVSPDNDSRIALNVAIHRLRQWAGQVGDRDRRVTALVARQELTGADRQWAARYERGNLVRYTKGSRVLGLAGGEYARVVHVDVDRNELTIARQDGSAVAYDPRRLQGVTVFREAERAFAPGDRVQLTAPYRDRGLANRELGTLEHIDTRGTIRIRFDSGRVVTFPSTDHRHLDHGYAVTSHSSQGQTANRVLMHVDTQRTGEALVNRRFAYVAVSRGREDVQLYTNDKARLEFALSRETSHQSAIDAGRGVTPTDHTRASAEQTRESPEQKRTPVHPGLVIAR